MGLITCGVLGILSTSFVGTPAVVGIAIAGDLLYAAAVLLFAIGLTREASIVARTPLGVTALSVVAVAPLLTTTLSVLIAPTRTPNSGDSAVILTYLILIVPTGAALIATVQIARAGIVPSPWRWAPLWVLAFQTAIWALTQILYQTLTPDSTQQLSGPLSLLTTLAFLTGTLGLGILGLLIYPPRAHTTHIYPPPGSSGDSR